MPAQSATTQTIIPRTLVIYLRKNSNIWQCRFKIGGVWVRASTNEHDAKLAANVADRMRIEAEVRKQNNLPTETRYFKNVAEYVIKQMQDALDNNVGKVIYKDYIYVINKYLIPIFQKYKMSGIDNAAMQMFEEKRLQIMKKSPSRSTLQTHNAALNMIFEYAVEKGYMAKSKVPILKAEGKKANPRPAFTLNEIAILLFNFDNWIALASEEEKEERELLKDYVNILLDTGMRAGKELTELKWQQIDYVSKTKIVGYKEGEQGEKEEIYETKNIVYMHVTGKNKTRDARGNEKTIKALQNILDRNYEGIKLREIIKENCSDYVITLKNKKKPKHLARLFEEYLKHNNLLYERKTQLKRVLYSLRHTYTTLALENDKVPMHTLTQQLGNSAKMVEQHYSHFRIREAEEQLNNEVTNNLIEEQIKQLERGYAFNLDEEDKQAKK
jgi:integrase